MSKGVNKSVNSVLQYNNLGFILIKRGEKSAHVYYYNENERKLQLYFIVTNIIEKSFQYVWNGKMRTFDLLEIKKEYIDKYILDKLKYPIYY